MQPSRSRLADGQVFGRGRAVTRQACPLPNASLVPCSQSRPIGQDSSTEPSPRALRLPPPPVHRRSDAFFCFHTINAFEAEGGLVVDLCGYDEVSWVETFRLPHLRLGKATPPVVDIRRWGAGRGGTRAVGSGQQLGSAGPESCPEARGKSLAEVALVDPPQPSLLPLAVSPAS